MIMRHFKIRLVIFNNTSFRFDFNNHFQFWFMYWEWKLAICFTNFNHFWILALTLNIRNSDEQLMIYLLYDAGASCRDSLRRSAWIKCTPVINHEKISTLTDIAGVSLCSWRLIAPSNDGGWSPMSWLITEVHRACSF